MKQTIKTYNTKELAEYFGVHPATIRIWVKSGKVREIDLGYRTKRYDLNNLL
tara:strand:+ start:428 stop:583 length:156 start_codon:yes stop_codon:yes gene_type:complete